MCIQLPIIVDQKLDRRSVGNLFSVKQNPKFPSAPSWLLKVQVPVVVISLPACPAPRISPSCDACALAASANPQAAVSRARANRIGRINPPKIGKRENAITSIKSLSACNRLQYLDTSSTRNRCLSSNYLAILRSRSQKAHLKGTNS
jgi:hypothetical protein